MRKIMNRKGQVMNIVSGTVIALMVLIITIFAVLFGIAKLNPSSFFTSASAEQNATNYLTGNLTSGVGSFAGYIPTILIVLGVVLALAGVVILIAYVQRMRGGGAGL